MKEEDDEEQTKEIQEVREESRPEDMDNLMQPPPPDAVKEELLQAMLNPSLKPVEKEEYMEVIHKFPDLFITSYEEIRGFKCEPMPIELKEGVKPVFQKLRRINRELLPVLKEELTKLLKAGLIYPVEHSDWGNPVVITPKHTG